MAPIGAQYQLQIWYQAPLFFATTALTAAVLMVLDSRAKHRTTFWVAFGRIALATAVPFAFTTMLVEVVVASLMLAGVIEPMLTWHWLMGDGSRFAAFYQSVGLAWLLGLMVLLALHSEHDDSVAPAPSASPPQQDPA